MLFMVFSFQISVVWKINGINGLCLFASRLGTLPSKPFFVTGRRPRNKNQMADIFHPEWKFLMNNISLTQNTWNPIWRHFPSLTYLLHLFYTIQLWYTGCHENFGIQRDVILQVDVSDYVSQKVNNVIQRYYLSVRFALSFIEKDVIKIVLHVHYYGHHFSENNVMFGLKNSNDVNLMLWTHSLEILMIVSYEKKHRYHFCVPSLPPPSSLQHRKRKNRPMRDDTKIIISPLFHSAMKKRHLKLLHFKHKCTQTHAHTL